ncbi:penicillin-binding protein activator [Palleronia sediminis]|uniref:Penicillin-binding protein activator n=1 Tax=Palleronia sediminis TaxID=2547833 RepID=A0A4R6AHJ9_9RHOB|nr:penicillin-binding protein activator [Palleronia sediminis]TDL81938.1 penicillin-binding protein activator [Palleronia sediminis]
MFDRLPAIRKSARRLAASLAAVAAIAACGPLPSLGGLGGGAGGGTGPRIDASAPVPVALLVPKGESGGGGVIGQALENAARLAATNRIDLRVYDTGGNPSSAAGAASRAVSEGAQIVLGPLYTQTTTAVTQALQGQNVNIVSFSNNTVVAGGNVFILGQTFADTAQRLSSFARRQGRSAVAIVHGDDLAGQTGRDAIAGAVQAAGLRVATVQAYPLSQQGITESGPRIAQAVTSSGADAVFLTAGVSADLPLIATALPENGVSPGAVQYLGLTRWNSAPQALALPGLQGGLFTLPNQGAVAAFEARYRAAYGTDPHPLAGLGFDAVAAVDALIATGNPMALTSGALTRPGGFNGAYGAFRLLPDGTNNRALAVAQVANNQVQILDPAPSGFGGAGL